MRKKSIKAIIFDMDGVMFDTERLYTEGFTMVIKKKRIRIRNIRRIYKKL